VKAPAGDQRTHRRRRLPAAALAPLRGRQAAQADRDAADLDRVAVAHARDLAGEGAAPARCGGARKRAGGEQIGEVQVPTTLPAIPRERDDGDGGEGHDERQQVAAGKKCPA
jgi:hypothetical protein